MTTTDRLAEIRQEAHAAQNTDRQLWRESDNAFASSLHVTEAGGIGMNVGGLVIVLSIEKWHALPRILDEKEREIAQLKKEAEQWQAHAMRGLELAGRWEEDLKEADAENITLAAEVAVLRETCGNVQAFLALAQLVRRPSKTGMQSVCDQLKEALARPLPEAAARWQRMETALSQILALTPGSFQWPELIAGTDNRREEMWCLQEGIKTVLGKTQEIAQSALEFATSQPTHNQKGAEV